VLTRGNEEERETDQIFEVWEVENEVSAEKEWRVAMF
jgi:hypothetical protein